MRRARQRPRESQLFNGIRSIGLAVSELVYPALCVACEMRYASERYSVCPYCWEQALRKRRRIVAPENKSVLEAPDEPNMQRQIPAVSLGVYCSPLSEMLQKFKYEGFISLGERLALALARLRGPQIANLGADALVPIPLHITGIKARGFNQAQVISDILSEVSGLPVATDFVEKIVRTKSQANLTAEERRHNLAGAFMANGSEFRGKKVIIVDDVITTGATISEVGMTIEGAGIEVVGAVAIASAIDHCSISKNGD